MVRQPFEFAQGKAHHKLRMAGNEQGSGGAGVQGRKRCRIADLGSGNKKNSKQYGINSK